MSKDGERHRRINIVILEHQYRALTDKNLNVSGLIRDLLGDYLSQSAITVQVSEETREIYDTVVSNTGAEDEDIEIHLRRALAGVLEEQIDKMRELHRQLTSDSHESPEEGV